MDPKLTRIQSHVDNVLDKVRNPAGPLTVEEFDKYLADVHKVREEIVGHLDVVNQRLPTPERAPPCAPGHARTAAVATGI